MACSAAELYHCYSAKVRKKSYLFSCNVKERKNGKGREIVIIWTNERDGVEKREGGLEEKRNDRGQRRRKQTKKYFLRQIDLWVLNSSEQIIIYKHTL